MPGVFECLEGELVVAFYNKRGTCERWIEDGKGAIHWTRLSCRTFAANAVRLQPAYNLGKFLHTSRLCCREIGKAPTFTLVRDSFGAHW